MDAYFPPGFDSMEQWGKTSISFGNTWRNKSYAYVTEKATEKQLEWYIAHKSAYGGGMKDFATYLEIKKKSDPTQPMSSSIEYIPGTSTVRKFVK